MSVFGVVLKVRHPAQMSMSDGRVVLKISCLTLNSRVAGPCPVVAICSHV